MNEIIPTGQAALDARADAAAAKAEATRRKLELEALERAAKADLAAQRAELDRQHREQMAALAARMAPVEAELAVLKKKAELIDLYLGRGENVEMLRGGKPAPADTPLVVRSTVLFADEESLILVEHGGLDFRTMGAFLDWIVAAPENLDRVVPDQRGIVVVKPSRQARDYGDPWLNNTVMTENERPHWILRNGERVYVLITGVDLPVGRRIVPAADEFTAMFTKNGKPLEPGSKKWIEAEDQAEAKQKHFMRLMLVIQGLVDRSVVFRPLPDGGLNVMSLAAQDAGHVVLLDEESKALTDGRPSFRAWQKSLNSRLRPGMRVILATGSDAFHDDDKSRSRDGWGYRHLRITPERCGSLPEQDAPHLIEEHKGGRFIIRFARTDEVWRRNVPVPDKPGYIYRGERPVVPSKRASLWFTGEESWVLPFDAATRDELAYYLHRRSDRQDYLNMVPVLRAALAAKDAEAAQEAGFRGYLAAQLGDDGHLLDELVAWFKTAHGSARPLTGDGPHEAKAAKAILTEYARRQKTVALAGTDAAVVAGARASIADVLAIVRLASGAYRAFTLTDPDRGPWLTTHALDATGEVTSTIPWSIIPAAALPRMDVLWSDPEWDDVPLRPKLAAFLTTPEIQNMIADGRAWLDEKGARPIAAVLTWGNDYSSERDAVTVYGWKQGVDFTDTSDPVDDHMMSVVVYWRRDAKGGLRTECHDRKALWYRYEHEGRRRPWRERGSHWFRAGQSAELVWCDPDQVALVDGYVGTQEARSRESMEQSDRRASATLELRNRLERAWLERETARERASFVIDFGYDAGADLWEHHLRTVKLAQRYREPRWAFAVFSACVGAGVDLAGKTVGQIVEMYLGELTTGEKTIDAGDFADLVMPGDQPADV